MVTYKQFHFPTKIELENKDNYDGKNGLFKIAPWSPGFAHTLGNTLRRVLLSSLEASAIVSVSFEGITHEFQAVDGIKEDVAIIVLNLKEALITSDSTDSKPHEITTVNNQLTITKAMLDNAGGEYFVKLKDLFPEGKYSLINPEKHIFTATQPLDKSVSFKVMQNRGYIPAEHLQLPNKSHGDITIDGVFSPVRNVNYYVEYDAVHEHDILYVDITTDGRVSPVDALNISAKITTSHMKVIEEFADNDLIFYEPDVEADQDKDDLMNKLSIRVKDIEFSVRASNCLVGASIQFLAELVVQTEASLLKFRNFGKKSLTEIKEKLNEMDLYLGMDLSSLSITVDNVKEVVKNYLEEKAAK